MARELIFELPMLDAEARRAPSSRAGPEAGASADLALAGKRALLVDDLDGFETTCRIGAAVGGAAARADAAGRGAAGDPVVVALTAHALSDQQERCREAGMDDFMTKPFDRKQLASVIQRWAPGHGV